MSADFCYCCAVSFGLFNKQLGCKNCGFAFCKKCLTKKTCVPKLKNEKLSVCNKCFDILTGKAQPVVNVAPPDAYTKRVMASQSQQCSTSASSSANVHMKGLSKEDLALAQRLQKLKEDRQTVKHPIPSEAEIENRVAQLKQERMANVPSEHEMSNRLAALRHLDQNTANQPSIIKPRQNKTEQEQIDSLLDQISDEVKIDSRGAALVPGDKVNDLNKDNHNRNLSCPTYNVGINSENSGCASETTEKSNWQEVNQLMEAMAIEMESDAQNAVKGLQKDQELWARVERLKAERKVSKALPNVSTIASSMIDSDEEDEETATKRIIQQIFEENCLDEEVSQSGFVGSDQKKNSKSKNSHIAMETDDQSDELPWCCICNNDAVLRCKGCDGDLYCQRCYREGHNQYEMSEHQTIPYKQMKK